MHSSSLLIALFAALASARTDLSGCVSSETVRYGGASLLWYVPGTGEICDFLDCGGGRAPLKTTVPGCPSYEGTGTYSPSFIALAASTTAAASSSTAPSSAMITGSQTMAEASESTSEVSSSPSDSNPAASGLVTSASSTLTAVGGQATGSSNSSTGSGSGNSSPSSTAPISSATDNAGALNPINSLIGVVAAVFAFLL